MRHIIHGFKLADCNYFDENSFLHPLISRCFKFLKNFQDAESIQVTYDIYGIDLILAIFRNAEKDMYYINIFFDNVNTSKYAIILPETERYYKILKLNPKDIFLCYGKRNRITSKVDIKDKILPI